MKKLYLIRHAKSSWKNLEIDDFYRPLNKRGELNAPFMAEKLKERGVIPDLILSSPALRAKKTAKILSKKILSKKRVTYIQNIYEAYSSELLEILKTVDDKHTTLFLVGHNPGVNDLAEYFVDFYDNIPTCGIVEIEFSCKKWAKISPKNAKLISFDYPKK
jgi:phosphohistidine phosphatase